MYVWKLALAKPEEENDDQQAEKKTIDDIKNPKETNPVWKHVFKNLQVVQVLSYKEEANSPLTMYLTVKDRSLREFSGETIKDMKEVCRME
jgi:hypothetical protein